MSKARITIIELDGLDVDSEFGLMRTLRDLLERTGGTVLVSAPKQTAAAPSEPESDDEVEEPEPAAQAPVNQAPQRAAAVRSQDDIDAIVIDSLTFDPAISIDALAIKAYGASDKNARRKLPWTLKNLAARGLVERLSASTWRVLAASELDDGAGGGDDGAEEGGGGGYTDDEPQELDLS
jgi:hypothetical protein